MIRRLDQLEQQFNLQIERLDKLSNKLQLEEQALSKKLEQLEESNVKRENQRIQECNSNLTRLREEKEKLLYEYFEAKLRYTGSRDDDSKLNRIFEEIDQCQKSIEYYEGVLNGIEHDRRIDVNQLIGNIERLTIEKNHTSELVSKIANEFQKDFANIQVLDKKLDINIFRNKELCEFIQDIQDKRRKVTHDLSYSEKKYLNVIYGVGEDIIKGNVENLLDYLEGIASSNKELISKYKEELKEIENLVKDNYLKIIGISDFIIDGNSVCTVNKEFLGILPLLGLIDFLYCRNYTIHVIFDDSFKQKFSQEERKILNKIAKKDKIYIDISENAVNEIRTKILDLADKLDANVYVITNDNSYTKFSNYEVVLCEKIVTFGISSSESEKRTIFNRIFIEDLLIDIDLSNKTVQDFTAFG